MPTLLLTTLLSTTVLAQTLPAEAQAVLSNYEKKAQAIREKADRETQPHLDKALGELQALQDQYCQQKKLDEAVAIRDRIRQLRGIQSDPGALHVTEADIGKTMLFEVTGVTSGSVWGTEVYTSDSHVGTAAVHQGVLKPGEKAVVRVKVIPGLTRGRNHLIRGLKRLKRVYGRREWQEHHSMADYLLFLGYSGLVLRDAVRAQAWRGNTVVAWGFHDGDLFSLARADPTGVTVLAA
ncbi:MAG: LCCL domain-containing protein [Myxococcaceae bacterium]|nr:LCCL domain-containing protein [Myxococcaceae bacterium]